MTSALFSIVFDFWFRQMVLLNYLQTAEQEYVTEHITFYPVGSVPILLCFPGQFSHLSHSFWRSRN